MTETVVCVGAVVRRGPKVLLVRQAPGHSMAGQWTIPWGRLDRGESAAEAAVRETLEEARVVARVQGLVGVQELPAPWNGWFALVYECEHVDGEPQADGRETDAASYFSESEMNSLREPIEPWTAWLLRRLFAGNLSTIASSDSTNPFFPSASFL